MPSFVCIYERCRESKLKNPDMKFVHFVKPKTDMKRAMRWVYLVGRSDFQVKDIHKNTVICQKHFPPDIELDWKKNPSLEPYPSSLQMETMPNYSKAEITASSSKSSAKIVVDLEKSDKISSARAQVENRQAIVKTYSTKCDVKTVSIPVYHGVQVNLANQSEIDFSGKYFYILSETQMLRNDYFHGFF